MAVVVACSCADSLPFTFVGPYLVAYVYRQNQELLRCGEEDWHTDDMLGLDSHTSLDTGLFLWNEAKSRSIFTPG